MKIVRVILLSILGLILPVGVAMAAFVVSDRSFETEIPLVAVERIAEPQTPPPSPTPAVTPTPSVSPVPAVTNSPDDRGGRCSEPEHAGDPECVPGGDGDNSGPGGGNSGSGSGNSGPGGGDD